MLVVWNGQADERASLQGVLDLEGGGWRAVGGVAGVSGVAECGGCHL